MQEYCVHEKQFEASCLKNEVIVMTSAIYGRMRMGRCLEDEGLKYFAAFGNDPNFLGCSEDILQLMDKKCSGKNRCEVRMTFDTDFENIKPCDAALKLYLEASYHCVTGRLETVVAVILICVEYYIQFITSLLSTSCH